ncbi:MAG: AAA family ATPase, partial [Candidatus Eremiobacteraeota bacterium]|nr:AAA family ATPase [Candidatus Eremiobacteraeota bacterium]
LALRAGAQGGRVVAGTTSSPESMPYEAIAQAFRVAAPPFSTLDVEPAWLSAVAQIVPQVRDVRIDLPALSPLDPVRERSRLFEAMSCCLNGFARSRPVVLIVEDLHWASSATIAALNYLARNIGRSSVLLVGTYREDEIGAGHPLDDLRRELQRESTLTHMGLPALAETAVRDLVHRLPELETFDRDAAERAAIQSRGNPLFLAAILRNFIEAPPEEMHTLPRGLKDTIVARVARFSDAARFLARVASVVGAAFDVETVRNVSGWNEHEVVEALDELLRFQVVRESASRSAFQFVFSHHLVQRAIYDEISAAERRRWHRRAASAIELIHRSRIDETAAMLARHFDLGEEVDRAATYYLRAARNALALYANDEALEFAGRGLEITSDRQERLELLGLCESIHGRQGRRTEQKLALDELERAGVEANNDTSTCDAIERRIRLHRALGDRHEERASIEALATLAGASGDMRWIARAAQERGRYLVSLGALPDARVCIDAALAAYRTLGDTRREAECLCTIAYADAISLKTVEGEQAMERAQALADADGNQELIAQTYYTASTIALAVEEYALCGTFAERAFERYREIGDREGEADAAARLGVIAARTFDVGAARTWYAKAAASYAAVGKKQGIGAVKLNGALLEFAIGRVDRSSEACVEAERIFSELGDVRGMTVSAINLAMANYYRGDQTAAKDLAVRALELARQMGSAPLEAAALSNLGAVERELGELEASLEHLDASIALRKKSGAIADVSLDVAELVLTHLRLGHTSEAQRLADELMALDPAEYATTWAPQTVPLAAALAYRALRKKKRAGEAIDLARRLFRERVARLPDAEGRTTYENISFNRELIRP